MCHPPKLLGRMLGASTLDGLLLAKHTAANKMEVITKRREMLIGRALENPYRLDYR